MERKKCTRLRERNLNLPQNIQVISAYKGGINVEEQCDKRCAPGKENYVHRHLNGLTRHASFDKQITDSVHKVRRYQSLDESASAKQEPKAKQSIVFQGIKTPDCNYTNCSTDSYIGDITPESEVQRHNRSASCDSGSSQAENSVLLSCSSVDNSTPLSGIAKYESAKNKTLCQGVACASKVSENRVVVYEDTVEEDNALLSGTAQGYITLNISNVYTKAIIHYLMKTEQKYTLSSGYPKVFHLTAYKRAVLVDWLIEVQHYLKLNEEILFLTVRLMDKFLDTCQISMKEAQLASVACVWIMSKYDAVSAIVPYADTLLRLCKHQYSMDQLILMERLIIKKCKYMFNVGQPVDFLYYFLKVVDYYHTEIFNTCMYLMNIFLINNLCVSIRPSCIAAASICATFTLHQDFTKHERFMKYFSSIYSLSEVREVKIAMLHGLYNVQNEKTDFTSAFKKYNSSKYSMLSSRIKRKMSNVLNSMLDVNS